MKTTLFGSVPKEMVYMKFSFFMDKKGEGSPCTNSEPGRLLDDEIIHDLSNATDPGRHLPRLGFLRSGIHESAELDDTLESLYINVEGLNQRIMDQSSFYLGGNCTVINIFTSAFTRRGGGTTGVKRNKAEGRNTDAEHDKKLECGFHSTMIVSAEPQRFPPEYANCSVQRTGERREFFEGTGRERNIFSSANYPQLKW